MQRPPPFDALIAFDAAVRHGSMTLAATELGLTQSAVSHRVRRLETFMGASLLRRHNTGLLPTPAGTAILEGLTQLLADLTALRARCQLAAAPHRLRVGIGTALAHQWLVRRLPEFTALYPHTAVELVIVENESPERTADLDLRVLWVPVNEARASSTQLPLFQERVFPVCHPSLLPAGYTPGDAAVLSTLPLLHKGPAGRDSAAEWCWSAWFERLGLPGAPKESLRFATIGPAIAAAQEGAGVVLARSLLVHDALAEKRLVRVLPEAHDRPSSKAHVVRWLPTLRGDGRVRSFAAWLLAQARQTGGDRSEPALG